MNVRSEVGKLEDMLEEFEACFNEVSSKLTTVQRTELLHKLNSLHTTVHQSYWYSKPIRKK